MINLAVVIEGTNFWETGYTLEYLGLGDMTKEQILEYLHEGAL